MQDALKAKLLNAINYTEEFNELLGQGKGNARSCFNKDSHKRADKTPSLSFNPTNGGWKCHSCGLTGDVFSLYMYIKNVTFPAAYRLLLDKYKLSGEIRDFNKERYVASKSKTYTCIANEDIKDRISRAVQAWMLPTSQKVDRIGFMQRRYGLKFDTMLRYKVGYDMTSRRVWIPIHGGKPEFLSKSGNMTTRVSAFVNIRKHDCFRNHANWYNAESGEMQEARPNEIGQEAIERQELGAWQPIWSDVAGKVLSVKGHGCVYLYPFDQLLDNDFVYLVGGELKALMLVGLGIPAVSFTAGEGSFNEDFLPYFMGKRVRVLFDADPKSEVDDNGFNQMDRAARKVAQHLANAGAIVEVGTWPLEVKKLMPPKGDVTDFLKMAEWETGALDLLVWSTVERLLETDDSVKVVDKGESEDLPLDYKKIHFTGLTDPKNLGTWVRVPCLISGQSDIPYVVPKEAIVTCKVGEGHVRPKCIKCALPKCGFRQNIRFAPTAQVELVGTPMEGIEDRIKKLAGVPPHCSDPDIELKPSAASIITITPTVDAQEGLGSDNLDEYCFEHRAGYCIDNGGLERVDENAPYILSGKIISDPRRGTFSLAAVKAEGLTDDILHYKHDQRKATALRNVLWADDAHAGSKRLVLDLRDHVVQQLRGADDMIEATFLNWFMPFSFHIGQYRSERVCPAGLILGDTNVGKSTAAKALIRHFGAGRYASADADPTFAGLVGGNMKVGAGGNMAFHWGLLPTTNRATLVLDEYNKLSHDVIAKLTNTMTTGIAERVTVKGAHRTQCRVRMLYLGNPRGTRKLTSYSNPLDAALAICGTPQDLGRIEYVHVQYMVTDRKHFATLHKPEVEHRYTHNLARYHLQWVWSRKPTHFRILDPEYLVGRAVDTSDEVGGHVLLLAAQARWKVGKIACAIASMLYSTPDDEHVDVKREHINWACDFLLKRYKPYIVTVGDKNTFMDGELVSVFNALLDYRKLRFLSSSDRWSMEDIISVFPEPHLRDRFLKVAYYDKGLIQKTKGGWYVPRDHDAWSARLDEYMTERERSECGQ